MSLYSLSQMQAEIERVRKVTHEETLRVERQRVANAAALFANTTTDEHISAAIYELVGFLYEAASEEVAAP